MYSGTASSLTIIESSWQRSENKHKDINRELWAKRIILSGQLVEAEVTATAGLLALCGLGIARSTSTETHAIAVAPCVFNGVHLYTSACSTSDR